MSDPVLQEQSVQWYNAARRIPILIGKLPSGEQIWGGPYRASQAVTAGVVLLVGFSTRGLWGGLVAGPGLVGTITSALVCVGVAAVCGFAAGRLPFGANPVLEAAAAGPQLTRASAATWCGSRLRVGPTYRLRGPRVVQIDPRLLQDRRSPTPAREVELDLEQAETRFSMRRAETVATASTPSTPSAPSTAAPSPAQKLAALMETR